MLLDGDEVITDSPRILAHLEERFPEPPLYPRDEARRAEVETFLDWFNLLWKRAPNLVFVELEQEEPDDAQVARLGARMRLALDRFESLLAGRDYLFGDFGVADATAFPFLKYAVLGLPPGDDELFHRILVEHQPLGDGYARLRAWVHRVDALPRA